MTASKFLEVKFSIFTLALLEDTGWYNVNYDYADEFIFGLKEGCDFINEGCNSE